MKSWKLGIGIFLFVVMGLGVFVKTSKYTNKSEDFFCRAYHSKSRGTPMTVLVEVRGIDNTPVHGAEVFVDNTAGGNSGNTDSNGQARVPVAEIDIQGVRVNEMSVVGDRNWLNASKGVVVEVKLNGRQ